jgi:hypothetical protein
MTSLAPSSPPPTLPPDVEHRLRILADRWAGAGSAERANYALFRIELCEALAPVALTIRVAFVFGSVAKGQDAATSDVDVMIISDSLGHGDVYAALEGATRRIGRQLDPTIHTTAELTRHVRGKNSFVTRVLAQPKIWLIGSESDVAS